MYLLPGSRRHDILVASRIDNAFQRKRLCRMIGQSKRQSISFGSRRSQCYRLHYRKRYRLPPCHIALRKLHEQCTLADIIPNDSRDRVGVPSRLRQQILFIAYRHELHAQRQRQFPRRTEQSPVYRIRAETEVCPPKPLRSCKRVPVELRISIWGSPTLFSFNVQVVFFPLTFTEAILSRRAFNCNASVAGRSK